MHCVVEVDDWEEWNRYEALEPWQWVALSVRLPPTPESLVLADELSGGLFFESEQGQQFQKRKNALDEALRRGDVPGVTADGKVLSSGFIVWCWIEDASLPDELLAIARPRVSLERAALTKKLKHQWKSMGSDFAKMNSNGLAYVASLHSRKYKGGHGKWDEDGTVFWAQHIGHMLCIAREGKEEPPETPATDPWDTLSRRT